MTNSQPETVSSRVLQEIPRRQRRLAWLVVAGLLLVSTAFALRRLHHWVLDEPCAPVGGRRVVTLHVRSGMSFQQIIDELAASGILDRPARMEWAARLTGLDRGIQQGDFVLQGNMSCRQILSKLQVYSIPSIRVRLKEGLRTELVAAEVARATGLDSTRFMEAVLDSAFTAALGFDCPNLEGLLFPDTYLFSSLENEREIIVRMCNRFRKILREIADPAGRDTLELRRLVILASIVEAEYQVASEADTIASVYLNRLARGMRLQADPTVQYALPDGPRRLLYRDLEIDSPYNTYRVYGLPPGPINCPGRRALEATLRPARSEYLYFVSQGDGTHAFARNYSDHLENRRPLDALRRQRRRAARLSAEGAAERFSPEQATGDTSGRAASPNPEARMVESGAVETSPVDPPEADESPIRAVETPVAEE